MEYSRDLLSCFIVTFILLKKRETDRKCHPLQKIQIKLPLGDFKEIFNQSINSVIELKNDAINLFPSQMDRVHFTSMQAHHAEAAAKVITTSFLALNKIWKNNTSSYQDVFPVIRGTVIASARRGWSFVVYSLCRSCSRIRKLLAARLIWIFLTIWLCQGCPPILIFSKK